MKEDNEFQKIGKNIPYKAPDGFFELVSEKTLLKAKQREKNRKKILVLWRTLAVAASLAAVVWLGYFIQDTGLKQVSNPIVQNEQQTIQKQEVVRQPVINEIIKSEAEKVPEKTIVEENNTEVVSDVLAELTDDELQQLATMYKTDPFIGDSVQ